MISQRQLARMLNLSPATVSRALRNLPGTDARTQATVLEAAAREGYRGGSARGNDTDARRATPLVGMLICGEDPGQAPAGVFARLLHGASESARQFNLSLLVDSLSPGRARAIALPGQQPPALRDGKVGGLILVGPFPPESVAELAIRHPCVRLTIRDVGVRLDCIGQDDQQAAHDLVEHLWRRGHRRIGFFCANRAARFTYGRARFAGYLEAMTLADLPLDPRRWVGVQGGVLSEAEAFARAEALTRAGTTAWVCVHDALGYGLLAHLAGAGLRVPQDVSLVGFDAIPAPLGLPLGLPRLTSIQWPFEEMGATAVRRLLRRIRNPLLAVGNTVYPGTLIPGQSTRPVGGAG